jgi:hypothetical protein
MSEVKPISDAKEALMITKRNVLGIENIKITIRTIAESGNNFTTVFGYVENDVKLELMKDGFSVSEGVDNLGAPFLLIKW